MESSRRIGDDMSALTFGKKTFVEELLRSLAGWSDYRYYSPASMKDNLGVEEYDDGGAPTARYIIKFAITQTHGLVDGELVAL